MLPKKFCRSLLVPTLFALAACQANKPAPPKPRPEPVKPAPVVVNPHKKEVNTLMHRARAAFDAYRLTTPLNDNAYYLYLRVLSLDPDNAAAQQGIYDIAEKYLEWAMDSARAGRLQEARGYLDKARSVDDKHPNLQAVATMIDEHRNANRMTYYLATDGLDHKTDWMKSELADIARRADKMQATAIITARDDAEGRWIYQQMNESTPERLRARLEIGSRPNVRLESH